MAALFSFSLLFLIKVLALTFYRFRVAWLSTETFDDKPDIRLMVLLNHTSLYEPLFVGQAPNRVIWSLARHFIVPGADITTQRPLVGRLLRALLPGMIPISRKRDESWRFFLDHIHSDSIVLIMPEGRMRRADGLDKHGQPMTVRAGVADILQRLDSGKILFVYSGGLHHVQIPGQRFPRLFQTIHANLELVDVAAYKQSLANSSESGFSRNVVNDMQQRLEKNTPHCPRQPHHKSAS